MTKVVHAFDPSDEIVHRFAPPVEPVSSELDWKVLFVQLALVCQAIQVESPELAWKALFRALEGADVLNGPLVHPWSVEARMSDEAGAMPWIELVADDAEAVLRSVLERYRGYMRSDAAERTSDQPVAGLSAPASDDRKVALVGKLVVVSSTRDEARLWQSLVVDLKNSNAEARAVAAAELGKHGVLVAGLLAAALKDSDAHVRRTATEALVRIGRPAVMPLVEALMDRDGDVRAAAAAALRQFGQPAVGPLVVAVRNSEWSVRQRW